MLIMATSDTQFVSSPKIWKKECHNSTTTENVYTKDLVKVHAVEMRSFVPNSTEKRKEGDIKPWRLPNMAQTNSPGGRAIYTREKIRRYREYLKQGTKRPRETTSHEVPHLDPRQSVVLQTQCTNGSLQNTNETVTRKRPAHNSPKQGLEQRANNSESEPLNSYSFECAENFPKRPKVKSGSGPNPYCTGQIVNITETVDDILAWGRKITECLESPDHAITPSLSKIDLPQLAFRDITLFINEEGKTNVLGAGGYGIVSRGKLISNGMSQDIVAKFDRSSKNRYEEILDEARILQHLSQTGVVPKLYGIIENKDISKLPFIVQECFADGEDFVKALNKEKLSKKGWVEACLNAAYGLEQIHKRKVLHNDLKPDNILVNDEGEIRFIDMGMATLGEGMFYPKVRSLCRHLSPEAKRGEETTTFSDIYGLGIVIQDVAKVANIPELLNISKPLLGFLPSDRITLRDLVVRLKELLYFFKNFDTST